jgi:general secretion pathway protein D
MVIGGLIRDNLTTSETKVPFLGDIPLLGWLFKFKSTKLEKTNLMIFITPYIIKNEQDAEAITRRNFESQEEFRKEQRFEKKGKGKDLVFPGIEEKKESGKKESITPPAAASSALDTQKTEPGTAAPAAADKPAPEAEKTPAPAEGPR